MIVEQKYIDSMKLAQAAYLKAKNSYNFQLKEAVMKIKAKEITDSHTSIVATASAQEDCKFNFKKAEEKLTTANMALSKITSQS